MNIKQNRILQYLISSKEELAKVTWPQKKTVFNHTVLVVIVSILVAAFLGLLDMLFSWGIERIVR